MQIMAFTDNHGDTGAYKEIMKKIGKAELVLCGGDFTFFENEWEEHARRIANLGRQVLLIHGNHESLSTVRKISAKHKNIHLLHDTVIEIQGFRYFGWGGGGFAERDEEFEHAVKKKAKHLQGDLIFMSHAPPHGTNLDKVWGNKHVGCRSFTEFIKKYQPRLALAGHIHDCFKKTDKIGKSLLINPGPRGTVVKIHKE